MLAYRAERAVLRKELVDALRVENVIAWQVPNNRNVMLKTDETYLAFWLDIGGSRIACPCRKARTLASDAPWGYNIGCVAAHAGSTALVGCSGGMW
jgi:hypothetical protein